MAMWTQYLCIRWRKFPKLIKSLICVYKNVHDFQTQFSLSQSNFLQLFESSLIISLLPNKRKPSKETFVGPFHCFSIDFWISIKGDKKVKYWPGIESAAKKTLLASKCIPSTAGGYSQMAAHPLTGPLHSNQVNLTVSIQIQMTGTSFNQSVEGHINWKPCCPHDVGDCLLENGSRVLNAQAFHQGIQLHLGFTFWCKNYSGYNPQN